MPKRTAFKKKRVGGARICSQKYLMQIFPEWAHPPVPPRFWQSRKNRRDYLLWLTHKLGYERMEDLYKLSYMDMRHNHGGSLASLYWHTSPFLAVKESFPEYDWHEWLFISSPSYFWDDKRNHRRYMDWLGQQLGVRRTEDWYSVTTQDFYDHNGSGFLFICHCSVSLAIMNHLPEYDWKEWMFVSAPNNFWQPRENRRRYMTWLGEQLGYTCLDDWYRFSDEDLRSNYGRQLLSYYNGSRVLALTDLIPRRNWHEWKFAKVPPGFWGSAENRKRYVEWLGRQLGYRTLEDWKRVRARDFKNNYGGGLLVIFGSYTTLLQECLPELTS